MGGVELFGAAFRDRKVIVTGHTGFKGAWLAYWLVRLGAKVAGVSLEDGRDGLLDSLGVRDSLHASYVGDVSKEGWIGGVIESEEPDFVFHLGAQALVGESYRQASQTFRTNVQGTVEVLEGIRLWAGRSSLVIITSDKCYRNDGSGQVFREGDRLGGSDPYSASKACAELVVESYRESFFTGAESKVRVSTGRAGNVIGGGDWGQERLVPDVMRGVRTGAGVVVRCPGNVRPWQHVFEPLSGYLWLGACMDRGEVDAGAFNFGPGEGSERTVMELIEEIRKGVVVRVEYPMRESYREARSLRLDVSKVEQVLGWRGVWGLERAVEETVGWYRESMRGGDMRAWSEEQLSRYERDAVGMGIRWAS